MAERPDTPPETFIVVEGPGGTPERNAVGGAGEGDEGAGATERGGETGEDVRGREHYLGPQITNKPPVATRACLSCRKLKMKCVGSADPPCERCFKTGRDCEFLQPGQTPPAQRPRRRRPSKQPAGSGDMGQHQTPGEQFNGIKYNGLADRGSGFRPIQYDSPSWAAIGPDSANGKRNPLPSVHHAENGAPVIGRQSISEAGLQQPVYKRRRTIGHASETPDAVAESLSVGDMEQLLELFQERLLRFIPVLGQGDFDDIPTMMREKKALVYCVCYVTARFLPGGSEIREKLFRPVSDILNGTTDSFPSTPNQSLAKMQALIVLYAYSQAVPCPIEDSQSPSKELVFWRIKALTESYANRLFLCRSVDGVQFAISSKDPEILDSYSYKMFTYWLWLYTMSQYGSQITRTPPTIRADKNIRSAAKILKLVRGSKRVSDLDPEIMMCIDWEEGGLCNDIEKDDWWSPLHPERDDSAVLIDKDKRNDLQRERNNEISFWMAHDLDVIAEGTHVDFHDRFVRFCIATYGVRFTHQDAGGSNAFTPAEKEAVVIAMDAAFRVLSWALDQGPVSKDRLRYLGDISFAVLSFCAFFLLQAVQAFASAISDSDEFLDTVEDTATLMTELAMDSKHAPSVYGKSLLLLLAKIRNPSRDNGVVAPQELAVSNARSRRGLLSATQNLAGNDPSTFTTFVPGRSWDFASLFPDLLCS